VSKSCLQSSLRSAPERVRSLASHLTSSSLFATTHEPDLLRASELPCIEFGVLPTAPLCKTSLRPLRTLLRACYKLRERSTREEKKLKRIPPRRVLLAEFACEVGFFRGTAQERASQSQQTITVITKKHYNSFS
jgi:hypothetical protein